MPGTNTPLASANDNIKLFYHCGPYFKKNIFKSVSNLVRYGTLYTPSYNAGDQISPVIVSGLSGQAVQYAPPERKHKLICVGSVLAAAKDHDLVWGSGLKHAAHARFVSLAKDLDIRAVRGPDTRDALLALGVDCPAVYGDPALLLPMIYPRSLSGEFKLGIIPHIKQTQEFEAKLSLIDRTRIRIITPRDHWKDYIDQLCTCEAIITSSLHGVIFAEAYGIPTLLTRHEEHVGGSAFKFEDYFHSTQRELSFIESDRVFSLGVDALHEMAQESERPSIDLRRLMSAFPYPLAIDRDAPHPLLH